MPSTPAVAAFSTVRRDWSRQVSCQVVEPPVIQKRPPSMCRNSPAMASSVALLRIAERRAAMPESSVIEEWSGRPRGDCRGLVSVRERHPNLAMWTIRCELDPRQRSCVHDAPELPMPLPIGLPRETLSVFSEHDRMNEAAIRTSASSRDLHETSARFLVEHAHAAASDR